MRITRIIFSLNFLYVLLIAAQIAAIIFLCLYVPSLIPVAAAYAGAWLLSAAASVILLSRGGASEGKCAWFVLIAALPFAGAIIYLVAGKRSNTYGVFKAKTAPLTPLGKCANSMCGTCEAGYDDAVYFPDGSLFFKRLFTELKKAEKRVCIEFFIVSRGKIFDLFLDALRCAKKNGAEIKMLIDGVGSAFKIGRRDVRLLKQAGAEVKIFHRLIPVPRSRLGCRDHRKIITIDGKTAFTGGVNLADEYANISSPYGFWKDNGIVVYGTAAQVFEGMFNAMWRGEYSAEIPFGGEKICLPYCDNPPAKGFCEELYVQKISGAKSRVHIMTPYFCVSERLAGALEFAAKRGVDVKVILPHVPDKPYAFELSKATAHIMEDGGVKFFEFTPGFMHAKSVICDNEVFLGSYNFDFRSMRLNYECGIMFGGKICDDAEADFMRCLSVSLPLTEGKISTAKRLSRFILRLFAPLI